MYWRSFALISATAALFSLPSGAMAQQKSVKEQLVGAWTVVFDDGVKADGTHVPIFGPNPIGSFIFTPNGRYSFQVMRTINRPRFASGNGQNGTPEEFKAAVQGA
jgi:Lipocalin-like domain